MTPEFESEALAQLDRLYGTALRLTRDPGEAEDLVQETYLKAFRFARRFQRGTNLRAWLFTILYNTFFNTRRARKRNPVDVNSDVVDVAAARPSGAATPEELLLRSTLDHELRTAVDALPETFRDTVWLRDVEDFSYAEIADMLGIPIGTVMSRLSRGRRQLYERLMASPGALGHLRLAGRS